MTEQLPMDFEAARRARDAGMKRAADHADRVNDGWTQTAYANIVMLCRAHKLDAPILAEDIRELAYAQGLPRPPRDGRAWGSVFSRARRAGIISIVGHAKAKSSNLSPKPLWKVAA
jgi:hypothetical protein